MVKQINVFSENRPGKLEKITGVLAGAGVNIRAFKISSDEEYGVIKFLVDDSERGYKAFKDAGITVSLKDVLAVELPDEPGSLNKVLGVLRGAELNIEDAYGFVLENLKKAVIVLDVEDPGAFRSVLEGKGYRILGSSEMYSL